MNKDSLGDRMKTYEKACKPSLPIRMPVIIRVDGKAFHSYTKGCKRPFDDNLVNCMNETAKFLCENIQGCKLAYVQSDEISLLLVNYENINSQSWFNNNVQKMASVSAGLASGKFTMISDTIFGKHKLATFDSRVFVLPKEEVSNYFWWRQEDTIRNSVQMLARSIFSHKKCDKKDQNDLKDMCLAAGQDWDKLPTDQKFGRCIIKVYNTKSCINRKTGEIVDSLRSEWVVDNNLPKFTEDRRYINKYI